MAELITLARPYAKAAFEYADAENALDQWQSDLQLVAGVVEDDRIKTLLSDPALTTDAQAEAFIGLFGEEISNSCKRYLRVLAGNRRLSLAPEILALFAQFKAQKESSVDVEMVSALEVPDAIRERIAKALGERLQRHVEVSTRVDSSLLGGVLIRAGDLVIDGSVRGRLNKLAEALTN